MRPISPNRFSNVFSSPLTSAVLWVSTVVQDLAELRSYNPRVQFQVPRRKDAKPDAQSLTGALRRQIRSACLPSPLAGVTASLDYPDLKTAGRNMAALE